MTPEATLRNIMQVMLETLDRMYMVCMVFAFLIILLSIYRNYSQFGEFFGLKYMVAMLLTIVLLALFPTVSDYLFKGMLQWGRQTTGKVEAIMETLLAVEVDGSWYDSLIAGIGNMVYKSGIWLGKAIREIMIVVLCGLFIILKTLSPIFIAMMAVPELKSIGINFLTLVFGFIMAPLCMLFGDLTMIWVASQMWEQTGMLAAAGAAGASVAGGAGAAALTSLAASPPGAIVIATGALGALVSFACIFLLLCIVMYIGIPWACLSLFRGAGIGNALAMSLNTASNVMAVVKNSQAAGKASTGGVSTISKVLSGRGSGTPPAAPSELKNIPAGGREE